MNNPSVAVLMSTYNGEDYLAEQIESILNQTYQNMHLFIRDDCSTDNTIHVLDRFIENSKITVIKGNENLGYKNSFLFLLKTVVNLESEYQYFSFSDQDDVWENNKISAAINLLEKNKNCHYRLYYTGLTFVDENLNIIKVKDEVQTKINFGAEIVRHSISGATIVFSSNLARLVVQHDEIFAIHDGHDALVCRLNAAIGGSFVKDEGNYIKFRRHGNNASNATKGIFYKIKKELERANKSEIDTGFLIKVYYNELVNKKTLRDIDILINYKKSIPSKVRLLCNKRFRREKWGMNLLFYYRVVFNKL
ncbi:hypothetical protein DQM10_06160 [Leuconostoc mesenteroides subsp. mesenteroides]|uniref:glycosyltransferase n=1 Tax=Leuconostoc mesenteroides TaxID=1245 RepID=UPI000E0977E1|nr:glycosyltransferase [Leuconostoc mesenteroides]RDF88861.1 hypothetical protein DQM10_06160 [Leuconostoc mesenteroides subsp. mesenteroides]